MIRHWLLKRLRGIPVEDLISLEESMIKSCNYKRSDSNQAKINGDPAHCAYYEGKGDGFASAARSIRDTYEGWKCS